MIVTTASAPSTVTRATQAPANGAPQNPPDVDEFQASSPNKNDRAYEAASNFTGALGAMTEAAAKLGQAYTITGNLMGFEPGGLAGIGGLLAGTFDVARGASIAKQSAVNRNLAGSIMGNLQLLQGVSTYFAVLAPVFGALAGNPAVGTVIGKVASGAAAALFVGRHGVGLYAQAKGALTSKEAGKEENSQASAVAPNPGQTPSQPSVPGAPGMNGLGAQPVGTGSVANAAGGTSEDKSRRFEQTYALAGSVDQFFRGIGGLASFWNVAGGLMSGSASGGLFGIPGLGFIGSAYSVATGVAMTRHSAINRNTAGTVDGVLQTIGGLAAVGVCLLGPAGMARIPAIIATAAGVGRIAYQIYAASQQLGGDEDDKEGDDKKKKNLPGIAAHAVINVLNPFAPSTKAMERAEF
ncbi:MAG: hypothetical protein AB1758_30905 [Candidatus Eremiobacterota bacterium]